jgi:hypothetical protein
MMVNLFTHCGPAATMLQSNGDLKRKWTWAVEWLHDELERVGIHEHCLVKSLGSCTSVPPSHLRTKQKLINNF